MHPAKILVIAASLLPFFIYATEPLRGRLFEKGNPEKPLYLYERESRRNADGGTVQTKFTDADNVVVYAEEVVQTGDQATYLFENRITREIWHVTKKGREVTFEHGDAKRVEVVDEPVMLGPQLLDFVESKWAKISSGESIAVRLAVPDRLETIGFRFRRSVGVDSSGKFMRIDFRPTSFFVSLVVDPVTLDFHTSSRKPSRIGGPSFLKKLEKGVWKELEVETVFE